MIFYAENIIARFMYKAKYMTYLLSNINDDYHVYKNSAGGSIIVTVTEAAIILVGTGRPPVHSRHPSRSRIVHGGPGPSQCRSLATPGGATGNRISVEPLLLRQTVNIRLQR